MKASSVTCRYLHSSAPLSDDLSRSIICAVVDMKGASLSIVTLVYALVLLVLAVSIAQGMLIITNK